LDAALLHHFPERGTIDAVFGQPTWIHLTRRDKIGQAISMWRANETGIWDKTPESSRPGEAPQPAYDFNNIQSALLYILGCDHHWAQWFQRKSIQPIHITYEDYLTAKADTLFRVIAPVQKRAGITLAASPADLKFSTRFAIQRDAYTEAIRERFIADIDRLGLGT
jgi:LPS sulfotransferase NodH